MGRTFQHSLVVEKTRKKKFFWKKKKPWPKNKGVCNGIKKIIMGKKKICFQGTEKMEVHTQILVIVVVVSQEKNNIWLVICRIFSVCEMHWRN